jgi:hypothetical protein
MIADLTRRISREDYEEYKKFKSYAGDMDVADPEYETKKGEYIRNVLAPQEAYKIMQQQKADPMRAHL